MPWLNGDSRTDVHSRKRDPKPIESIPSLLQIIYLKIGNLVSDISEEIDTIKWNVYGKITDVIRSSSNSKSDLHFDYDAMGQRICKIVKPRNGSGVLNQAEWTYTYYVRDAAGNTIAVYDRDYVHPDTKFYDVLTQKENHLYGSSRVGVKNDTTRLASQQYSFVVYNADSTFDLSTPNTLTSTATDANSFVHEMGRKAYELVNHLGNVLVTVSDMRTANYSGVTVTGWNAVVNSATDYYAFGAPMPGRTFSSANYRYGFNGKENDPESVGTGEGLQDYGMRIYNPSLGRFLSVDPLTAKYPWFTPYQFASNQPIWGIDLDGKEVSRQTNYYQNGWREEIYTVKIKVVVNSQELKNNPEALAALKASLSAMPPITNVDYQNHVAYKLQYDVTFVDEADPNDPFVVSVETLIPAAPKNPGYTEEIGAVFNNKIFIKGSYTNGWPVDPSEAQKTLAHEVGHALGLYHPQQEVPDDPAASYLDNQIREDYQKGGETYKSIMTYFPDRKMQLSIPQFEKIAWNFDRQLKIVGDGQLTPEDEETKNMIRKQPSEHQSYKEIKEDFDPSTYSNGNSTPTSGVTK